ncbi:MAG: S8 family serine peptidase [Saprospiraceae bacterium]|nr:S8 family serine peptidase [Saprospiraceae bacterium]
MATENRPFRWRRLIVVAAAAILCILGWVLIFNPCYFKIGVCKHETCRKVDMLKFNMRDGYFKLPHRCNQLIFDPSKNQEPEAAREELRSKCFRQVKICPCGPGFELWEYPSVEGIDVGAPPVEGPRVGGIGLDIFPNIVIANDPPESSVDIPSPKDTTNEEVWPLYPQPACPANTEVKIAIVDSGVEPPVGNAWSFLTNSTWEEYWENKTCAGCPSNVRGVKCLAGILSGEPIDEHGHGTSVNGVALGASRPNFPHSFPMKFVNVRTTEGDTKTGDLFDALCGLYIALGQQPDIINISWGFEYFIESGNPVSEGLAQNFKNAFSDFLNLAAVAGVFVVAGVGNGGQPLTDSWRFYPASVVASFPGAITVGALNANGNDLAEFSNFNPAGATTSYMDVAIRGEGIYVPQIMNERNSTGFAVKSGTSFAAPLVVRLAALMRSVHPGMAPDLMKQRLLNLATNQIGVPSGKVYKGIDLQSAAKKICSEPPSGPPVEF